MTAITVQGLRKAYDSHEAVRGVSFEVQRGEVFCLLGPNGAGKTTTVEILEGHRRADAGRVDVLGFDPAKGERALLDRIGIVLQSSGLPPALTVAELLRCTRAGTGARATRARWSSSSSSTRRARRGSTR